MGRCGRIVAVVVVVALRVEGRIWSCTAVLLWLWFVLLGEVEDSQSNAGREGCQLCGCRVWMYAAGQGRRAGWLAAWMGDE